MNGSQDLSGMIGKLTENPELMKSLMGIAGKLMNGEGDQKGDTPVPEDGGRMQDMEKQTFGRQEKGDDGDRRSSQCGQCADGDCQEGHRKGNRGSDAENLIRLLIALKPYVGRERCEKIDGIVKILKLVQLSEKTGLLRSLL